MKNTYNESLFYKIIRPIIKIWFKTFYMPTIIGKENIPKEGKIVLAGNHTNNFDCFLLMSCTKRCIHFLAKEELWHGFKKVIFGNLGLIPVNRKIHDHASLEVAESYLNDDKVIGIFPEGTISKTGEMLPFKIGAVKMAYDTNTCIVPFAITGDYKLFSKNLKIVFGKEISIEDLNLDKANSILKSNIEKLMMGDK